MKLKLLILTVFGLCFGAMATPLPSTITVGNATLTNSFVVAKGPVKLYTLCGYNSGPAQFIMIFQTNAVPNNGFLALHSFPVGTQQFYSFDFSYYGNGLDAVSVANSSTAATLTKGAADCSFQAIIAQ